MWFLQDLLVEPECQGRGVGSALIERCHARFAGVTRGVLLTDADGPTGFYERAGWMSDERIAAFLRPTQSAEAPR